MPPVGAVAMRALHRVAEQKYPSTEGIQELHEAGLVTSIGVSRRLFILTDAGRLLLDRAALQDGGTP